MEKKVFKLSPSSISLMLDCKRCFWLDKHNVWKRPSGVFPSLPSGMDRILKNHFDKFMRKKLIPPELVEKDYCNGLKLYDDEDKLKIWRNNFKGLSYKDKEGNELHGAIDNMMVNKNKLVVLDYKTRGFPLKSDTHEHYTLQMDIYTYLLKKMKYKVETFALLLFYYPREVMADGSVIFDTEIRKIKVKPKRAEDTWKEALEVLNGNCPKKTCQWCEKV